MRLTQVAQVKPVHQLEFRSNSSTPGIVTVSFDYMRTYLIANAGCGVSDEYHLRVNGLWLPFRGVVEDMIRLANQVEAQNEYPEEI